MPRSLDEIFHAMQLMQDNGVEVILPEDEAEIVRTTLASASLEEDEAEEDDSEDYSEDDEEEDDDPVLAAQKMFFKHVKLGIYEVLEELEKNKFIPDPNITNSDGDTALHIAIKTPITRSVTIQNMKEVVRFLLSLDSININFLDSSENTPLMAAIHEMNFSSRSAEPIIDLLLADERLTPQMHPHYKLSPLAQAISYNMYNITHKMLESNKCDIDHISGSGTALHHAVYNGNSAIIQDLIDHHANLEAINTLGLTPIEVAISMNRLEISKILHSKALLDKISSNMEILSSKDNEQSVHETIDIISESEDIEHTPLMADSAATESTFS